VPPPFTVTTMHSVHTAFKSLLWISSQTTFAFPNRSHW